MKPRIVQCLKDLPTINCWVIAKSNSVSGDDGYGDYDTTHFCSFEIYDNEKEWAEAVAIYTRFPKNEIRAFKWIPAQINIDVEVKV